MVEERLATLLLLRKGLSFMMNRELARGWAGWMGTTVEGLRQQQLARRAISRMVAAGLGRGFGAWAARAEPIPCVITAMADEFGGEIPVGPFAIIGDDSIGRGIVATLEGHRSRAVLMQNHGVFTIGRSSGFGIGFFLHHEKSTAAAGQEQGHDSANDDELLVALFGGVAFGRCGGGC